MLLTTMLTIKILHVFTINLLKKTIHSKHYLQFLLIIKALNFASKKLISLRKIIQI